MIEGIIVKANSGFYYVKCDSGVIECRARGIFRKQKITPLVGDRVRISQTGDSGTVEEILPRKNSMIRPPVANIDILFIIVSTVEPEPNMLVIDKMIAAAEQKGIEPAVIVTKNDLKDGSDIVATYNKAGIKSFFASGITGEGIEELKSLICGHIGAFTGNSGVGKSTLLNRIDPSLSLSTGEISKKLGRGRHTTRLVELFETCGGYIADTPGFSSLDTFKFEPILKEDLQYVFREFEPYINKCRFTGCSHTKETGCAVLEALKNGEIAPSRHKSYCEMYEEAKNIKAWQLKK
ncbi:putative ribosome biogenesis GTPase RsgA [[Clostridium] cellulosi]|uniref:Small ribosomal subunit biogenesis GTPase RsgA n=1 Tax=[Clostridium] cellulosi TaxID=29343 RepID=A0A078KL36_9FIRM|nr:putative ribosome biogenesis GTPase RsgA [[Clostridium] cellulosi]